MLPAMQLEGPAAFLASDTGWLLMAVAQTGAMRVWDLQVGAPCLNLYTGLFCFCNSLIPVQRA